MKLSVICLVWPTETYLLWVHTLKPPVCLYVLFLIFETRSYHLDFQTKDAAHLDKG